MTTDHIGVDQDQYHADGYQGRTVSLESEKSDAPKLQQKEQHGGAQRQEAAQPFRIPRVLE